eukprot:6197260-Pleurochrysis_carterae.AAC.3
MKENDGMEGPLTRVGSRNGVGMHGVAWKRTHSISCERGRRAGAANRGVMVTAGWTAVEGCVPEWSFRCRGRIIRSKTLGRRCIQSGRCILGWRRILGGKYPKFEMYRGWEMYP